MANQGITIFVVFFGVSLLDALSGGHWLRVEFWLVMGGLFWVLDRVRLRRRCGPHADPGDSRQA